MGPLTTRDHATNNDPLTVPSEDSTDISAKGLLPQLIDLLHALTEAQEMLSRRVRDAGLEHTRRPAAVDERLAQTDSAIPGFFVGASSDAAVGIRRQPPMDDVEVGAGQTTAGGPGDGPLPNPKVDGSAAPVRATPPQATSSSPPSGTANPAVMPDDLHETSTRTDGINSVIPGGETSTVPSNRDYNFFDELDARLADLQDPSDRSGDS